MFYLRSSAQDNNAFIARKAKEARKTHRLMKTKYNSPLVIPAKEKKKKTLEKNVALVSRFSKEVIFLRRLNSKTLLIFTFFSLWTRMRRRKTLRSMSTSPTWTARAASTTLPAALWAFWAGPDRINPYLGMHSRDSAGVSKWGRLCYTSGSWRFFFLLFWPFLAGLQACWKYYELFAK